MKDGYACIYIYIIWSICKITVIVVPVQLHRNAVYAGPICKQISTSSNPKLRCTARHGMAARKATEKEKERNENSNDLIAEH